MAAFIIIISSILALHAIFTIIWMLYSWNDPDYAELHSSPKNYLPPKFSFTTLVPAKNEVNVIGETIKQISKINYPKNLSETLILIKPDDLETWNAAQRAINETGIENTRIISVEGSKISKPASLNVGLSHAKGDFVSIFDAEDHPHPEIFNSVNTIAIKDNVDIIQGGVQLMNYKSTWFSLLNVLEYFFWFKSGLHFFTNLAGVTPLGGNTVFFKRSYLNIIGGWQEDCLTEDAEIGIRMVAKGARVRVFYDPIQATQEETPPDTDSFIRQRTRWNQGFLQILTSGEWLSLPSTKQQLLMLYILLSPEIQAIMFLYTFVGFYIAISEKLPTLVAMYSFVPFYLFIIQLTIYMVGIFEFAKAYKLGTPWTAPLKLLMTYIPYNVALLYSSMRAFIRFLLSYNSWEKTEHLNAHRQSEDSYAVSR